MPNRALHSAVEFRGWVPLPRDIGRKDRRTAHPCAVPQKLPGRLDNLRIEALVSAQPTLAHSPTAKSNKKVMRQVADIWLPRYATRLRMRGSAAAPRCCREPYHPIGTFSQRGLRACLAVRRLALLVAVTCVVIEQCFDIIGQKCSNLLFHCRQLLSFPGDVLLHRIT